MTITKNLNSRYDLAEELFGQGLANFRELCQDFPAEYEYDPIMAWIEELTCDKPIDRIELNDLFWFEDDTNREQIKEYLR